MLRHFDRAADGLMVALGLGLIGMVVLSVYNVISRYIFNNALLWADEVAVFAMIALVWLGGIVCAWRGAAIRMDIFIEMLPQKARTYVIVFQELVIALTCGWVFWLSYQYVTRIFRFGMTSDGAGLPLWIVHAVLPANFVLVALIAAFRIARLLTARAQMPTGLSGKEPTP